MSYKLLGGECYWLLDRPRNPQVFFTLRPDRVTIGEKNIRAGQIVSYTYKVGSKEETIPAELIIHFKRLSLTNDIHGQPVIKAGETSLNLDKWTRDYNANMMKRGGVPPLLLSAEGDLTEDQAKLLGDRWDAKHSGTQNAGKVAVMGAGLKAQELGRSDKDGSYGELSTRTRKEILSMFGVPAIIAGDFSDASVLKNADVQERLFWRDTILRGEMSELLGVLNEMFLPLYGVRGLRLEPDESKIEALQEAEGDVHQRVSVAVGGPYMTINEGRIKAGLDPLGPEGDVVYVDPNKLPLGEKPPPPVAIPIPMPTPGGNGSDSGDMPDDAMPEEMSPQKSALIIPRRRKSLVGAFGSDEHKAHFKAFVDRVEPQVTRMAERVAQLNVALLREVLAKVEAQGKGMSVTVPDFRRAEVSTAVLFDLDEAGDVYVKELLPFDKDALDSGADRAIGELGGGAWDMERPEVKRWLAKKTLAIKTLPETLHTQIKGLLTTAVDEGQTIQQIAGSLRDLQPGYEGYMAQRVARTEVIGANNAGSLECYRQNDVTQKEWSTAEDEDVRDTHRAVHGEVVPIDDTFHVGDWDMDAPGDPSAGPEEICSCRCAVLPVVD